MTEVVRSYIQEGIGLIQLAGLLVVGAVVLTTWSKTKSVMATVSAMAVGALVLGYLMNADWFGRKMAEDIQSRENGLPVFTGGPRPATVDLALAGVELWLEIALTLIFGAIWLSVPVLLCRLNGWRFDLGSPRRAAKRVAVRAKWDSVARSCGLAVTKDRRSSFDFGAVVAAFTGPVDKPRAGGAEKATVERLPKIRHGHTALDRKSVTYTLTPARGQDVEDVAEQARRLADGLHVHRAAVRRTGPTQGELTLYLEPVFHLPAAWYPVRMAEPAAPWGEDEYGKTTHLPLGVGHMLVASETGGGKSNLVNSLVGSLAVRPDVALLGVDLKFVELFPWADRFTAITTDGPGGQHLIESVALEVRRRYEAMAAAGIKKMTAARPDIGPWLVVVIDELSEFLAAADKAALVSVARLGRSCGVILVCATQNPNAKTLSTELRDQLGWRWCGRMASSSTAAMVLGDGYEVDPCAITIAQRGVGVVVDHLGPPRLARSWLMTDEQVTDVARETAHLRVPLSWLDEKVAA